MGILSGLSTISTSILVVGGEPSLFIGRNQIKRIFSGLRGDWVFGYFHLLFVDDIMIFSNGIPQELELLKGILSILGKVVGMVINFNKSSLLVSNLRAAELQEIINILPMESS